MKYKSIALPEPTVGKSFKGIKDQTVPNSSMSLQEILERFTRNEALPIGKDAQYHESDDDLEKIAKSDLVDRVEFMNGLEDVKKRHDKQEKDRKKRLEAEALEQIKKEALEKAEKEKSKDNSGSAK